MRRSRERIAKNEGAALDVLYYILYTFSKACAPAIPFMAEEIFLNLKQESIKHEESVHLEKYPDFQEKIIEENKEILEKMKKVRDLVSAALSVRVNNKIPVRQPLASLTTLSQQKLEEDYLQIVREETNIKDVKYAKDLNNFDEGSRDAQNVVAVDLSITKELKVEGLLRDMIRKFQDERKKSNLNVQDKVFATYPDTKENKEVIEKFAEELKTKILAEKLISGEEYHVESV